MVLNVAINNEASQASKAQIHFNYKAFKSKTETQVKSLFQTRKRLVPVKDLQRSEKASQVFCGLGGVWLSRVVKPSVNAGPWAEPPANV